MRAFPPGTIVTSRVDQMLLSEIEPRVRGHVVPAGTMGMVVTRTRRVSQHPSRRSDYRVDDFVMVLANGRLG